MTLHRGWSHGKEVVLGFINCYSASGPTVCLCLQRLFTAGGDEAVSRVTESFCKTQEVKMTCIGLEICSG